MAMRDFEDLKDIHISKEEEDIMDILLSALDECCSIDCSDCPDRHNKSMRVISCMSLKFARFLVLAGFRRDSLFDWFSF